MIKTRPRAVTILVLDLGTLGIVAYSSLRIKSQRGVRSFIHIRIIVLIYAVSSFRSGFLRDYLREQVFESSCDH